MLKRTFVFLILVVGCLVPQFRANNGPGGLILKVDAKVREAVFPAGVIPKNFPVEFQVRNISEQKEEFWVMGCSFEDHWSTDNKIVVVNNTRACDKNVPVLKSLKPGESYDGLLYLGIKKTSLGGQIKFRLNFSPLKNNLSYKISNTFKSNQIEIKLSQ